MSESEPTIVSFIGPTAAPPAWAIEDALTIAGQSPCQKRKVGIAIYRCERGLDGGRELVASTLAAGYNGPPWIPDGDDPGIEGACDGSAACRRDCARRCVHAEARAIDALVDGLRDQGRRLRLVHAKLDDHGRLMACDGPSCIDCSKMILDRGLGGIWLYERHEVFVETPRWIYYPAKDFHEATAARLGIYQVKGTR